VKSGSATSHSVPQRALTRVITLCSLALFAPLLWPLVTGRIFAWNDLGVFHLPMRAIYQQGLRAGDSLLWTPALFAGYYVHGEGQSGIFHPLHLVLYWLLPLQIAFNLEFIASYVAAFAGMYWFARRLALSRAAALFGGMLFAFSGFQLLHFLHVNLVAVVAHIPWLLASLDLLIAANDRRGRMRGFVAVACVTASGILLGFPQAVWWNVLAGSAFAIFRAGERGRWRRLIACAGAGLTGLLIGGIQLLPTLDMTLDSLRGSYPRTFALTYSLHPYNVLQFWSPYVFERRVYGPNDYPWVHEFGIYSGAILVVTLPWLWIRRHALGRHRAVIAFFTAFAVVTFVLALGRYGGLDVLLTYLPGIGSVRAPARYIVLVQFALATLAAIAFDDLATIVTSGYRMSRRDLAILCVPAALSILTILLVTTRVLLPRRLPFASGAVAAQGTAIVIAVTLLVLLAAGGKRAALAALVVLTAFDLGLWGHRYIYRTPPQTVEGQSAGIPPAPDDSGMRYAAAQDLGNRLLLKGYRMPAGYVGLYPATVLSFVETPFLRLSGTRWTFREDSTLTPIPGPVARARLLRDARVTDDVARDSADVNLDRTALVTRPLPALSGTTGTARVVIDRPGHLLVHTMTDGRQLLSISERYHEGWRATAEGRPLTTARINGDFLACVVEAGTHRVEFRFQPRSFTCGRLMSLTGLVSLALGVALVRRGM
jgi:hypothetical protein